MGNYYKDKNGNEFYYYYNYNLDIVLYKKVNGLYVKIND